MAHLARIKLPSPIRLAAPSRLAKSARLVLSLLVLAPLAAHAQGTPFDTGFNVIQGRPAQPKATRERTLAFSIIVRTWRHASVADEIPGVEQLSRSHTPDSRPSSCEELIDIALWLQERVDLGRNNAIVWWAWAEQLSRPGRDHSTTSAFRMKGSQSAAAAPVGWCFIISSIPFFISLAVGSALCVPTIHA